jgi:hypothetical protein
MNQFEAYAQRVTAGLDLPESAKLRIAAEVVAHLEDETQRGLRQNLSRPQAERRALELFGRDQLIRQWVAQALAPKQARFRRSRNLKLAVGFALGALFSIAVGAWFTVFNDAVSGREFLEKLPALAGAILYLGGCLAVLAVLGMIVAAIFRVSKSLSIAACLAVALLFFLSMTVFRAVPALRSTIGTIREGQSPWTTVQNAFAMRLYLCWIPTLLTALLTLCLVRLPAPLLKFTASPSPVRPPTRLLRFAAPFTLGLLSAFLWAFNYLERPAPWMYWMKWPKLLSTGLLALIFVTLAGLLAQSLAARLPRPNPRPSPFPPTDTPPSDGITPSLSHPIPLRPPAKRSSFAPRNLFIFCLIPPGAMLPLWLMPPSSPAIHPTHTR